MTNKIENQENLLTESSNNFADMKVSEKSPVTKGDVLLTSTPFAFVLKSKLRGLHCDNCFRKRHGVQRCSGCACSYYCNRECQKNSWEVHKKECPKLRKLKPNYPPDTARLLARVIFRLQSEGYEFEEKIDEERSRKFNDLMNHFSDVKEDSVRQEHFASLLVVLNKYLGEENLPSSTELLDIYGRLLVNSFTITDKDLNPVGIGVYLSASILDHSCRPNAYASFIGTKIYIRSYFDMPKLDWKKIRISYIDVLNTSKERKKELEKGYFFTCDCPHCLDKEREKICSTITCGSSSCYHPVNINIEQDIDTPIGKCPNCRFGEFQSDTRKKYYEALELTQSKLKEMGDKHCYDTCKMLLEKQGTLFHGLNIWRVKVLDAAFESALNKNCFENALAYGCENLEGLKFYYGARHPMYGMCLLKLGKIELYLFKLQDALDHLEEAEPIVRVSHGCEHPLYADDLAPLLKQAKQEIKMMQYNGFKVSKKISKEDAVELIS